MQELIIVHAEEKEILYLQRRVPDAEPRGCSDVN